MASGRETERRRGELFLEEDLIEEEEEDRECELPRLDRDNPVGGNKSSGPRGDGGSDGGSDDGGGLKNACKDCRGAQI